MTALAQDIQFIVDGTGRKTGVILTIEEYNRMKEMEETFYLLQSEPMRTRLLEAKNRDGGYTMEQTVEKLGI